MAAKLGDQILTSRLVLKLLSAEDPKIVQELVRKNIDHLNPWMPWAAPDVFEATNYENQLKKWQDLESKGTDFQYGL